MVAPTPLKQESGRDPNRWLNLQQYLREHYSRSLVTELTRILLEPKAITDTRFHSLGGPQYAGATPHSAQPSLANPGGYLHRHLKKNKNTKHPP